MTRMLPPFLLLVLALVALACEPAGDAPNGPSPPTGYDVPFLGEAELKDELDGLCTRARATGRPLLIEFSAAWCSDCRRLHQMKQAPALASELAAWPRLVVNVGRFDRHRSLLAARGVESIAHWEILAPTHCAEPVAAWPSLAKRTLEVSSGAARHLSPEDLAGWLAKFRLGDAD